MGDLVEQHDVARAVSISYHDLIDHSKLDNLYSDLRTAFGDDPDCLGILLVHDLPEEFDRLRQAALIQASRLAHLPAKERDALTSPGSNYLTGWSHGQEMANGIPDTMKGSFYFNPTHTYETNLSASAYPEYESPDLWPSIPDFQSSVVDLAKFIVEVGAHVARACDSYVRSSVPAYDADYLQDMVRHSRTCKARLLHYFPSAGTVSDEDEAWCGEHLDHGCLTGLTSAMYLDESGSGSDTLELDRSPDPSAGLYIKSRSGRVKKVMIPRSSLAFQTGQALQITTSGKLRAVPHFVRGSNVPDIARNTMAVFMQPNLDDLLGPGGPAFKDFARGVVQQNYGMRHDGE
ncbi:protein of unknown function [Taphrina deformans PYCC 5710]|uniref:Clavaminate synthase-like protein n=1 Tax=Taphrina deformans (strain PYCC 5710 / ATCC 11124 / CBS 356.35 / IMI 108563 / JCM 9778 / NBRC 8474) TaxID=1097556 RepID=R4XKR6_TAPDE|nr:protein of unknown function [Taphrina deformans PYCC 5710]|eukprot:CCG85019.1 protein of unknown function [Taphrina deformans PYCC 5710]